MVDKELPSGTGWDGLSEETALHGWVTRAGTGELQVSLEGTQAPRGCVDPKA